MIYMLAGFIVAVFATTAAAQGGLKIVVIEGEDAVNIIQQKTAVRPLVEVRDRNNLPVAGVLVTFSIEGGKAATFAGASTLTVATNAAGQAAVSGLTPSIAGAFQIQVSAVAQGQVLTATIAQTNVLTAAQAAAASASAASGGSASSAGGGAGGGSGGASGAAGGAAGGGGLSATILVVAGVAVGGGALVATQALKKDGAPAGPSTFTGSFSGQMVSTLVAQITCTITRAISGTMKITLDTQTASAIAGRAEISGSDAIVSQTCAGGGLTSVFNRGLTLTGTPSSFGGREQTSDTRPLEADTRQTIVSNTAMLFEASLSNGVITGTLKYEESSVATGPNPTSRGSANATFPITLR